ncbi:MAG: transposase, partial [Gammaproteobacteria bacterium]|nr:transposase [Gammaproteobacteria bacterium]NDE55534.1 transposase [Gammaproteobacteria bacterium]
MAQRAGNKKQVQKIHAKIKNRRKDAVHKFTRHVVDNNGMVVVGNVS